MTRRRDSPKRTESPAPALEPSLLPSISGVFDVRQPFLVPLLLAALSRALMWYYLPFAAEDAYITFRYARNFASGHGLVFNPGEWVMGFTSPVWTLWIALGDRLLHDPVLWSRLSAVCADAVVLLVLGQLLRTRAGRLSAWAFNGFFAVWPFFPSVSLSGMENGPMFALIALAAALCGARRLLGGVALGVLALWRPEGVAAAAALAIWAGWRERFVGAGILAAGALALGLAYGSPIPQSLRAKALLYGTPGPWAAHLWWDWLVPFPFGKWTEIGDMQMLLPLGILLFAGVIAGAREWWRLRTTPLAAVIAAGFVVWLGYAVLGVQYFFWYFAVPLATFATLAALGLPKITRSVPLLAGAALFIVGVWTVSVNLYVGRSQFEYFSFGRAGEYLRDHARPGETAMLEPIGLVGWLAPVRVLDEVGLVSPEVARRRLLGAGWYSDLVRERRPEWLVIRKNVLEAGVAFAGRGAPFRSLEERDRVFADYALTDFRQLRVSEAELQIWRRR